jgi:hypothetical protein
VLTRNADSDNLDSVRTRREIAGECGAQFGVEDQRLQAVVGPVDDKRGVADGLRKYRRYFGAGLSNDATRRRNH